MRYNTWLKEKISGVVLSRIEPLFDQLHICKITGAVNGYNALLSASLYLNHQYSVFYICNDNEEMDCIFETLSSYELEGVCRFPEFGLTPYQNAAVNEEDAAMRLDVAVKLLNGVKLFVVTTVEALLTAYIPPNILKSYMTRITVHMEINQETFIHDLVESGYSRTKQVTYPGEFAVRGNIVDIYFSPLVNPIRVDFFDTTIESINSFNPGTMKNTGNLTSIVIPPFTEILYPKSDIPRIIAKVTNSDADTENSVFLQEKIETFNRFDGEHFLFPLFYDKKSILDYTDSSVVIFNDIDQNRNKQDSLFRSYYDNFNASYNKYKLKFSPEDILFTIDSLYVHCFKIFEFYHFNKPGFISDINFHSLPVNSYAGQLELFKQDVKKFSDTCGNVIVYAISEAQTARLKILFQDCDTSSSTVNYNELSRFSILPLALHAGFIDTELNIMCLSDNDIFGKRNRISQHFMSRKTENIENFIDLKPGDYVVHIHHGIGKFTGIERVKSKDVEKDYIAILYADDDKIFIPVEQMNFVQKYSSGELDTPKLDRIGAKGWSKTKERVKESVNKLAGELVRLYSFRLNQKGFAFAPDTPWQKEFEAAFPYDETEDQLLTIEEVKRDMESPKPMDRLICGDVGFGKTEVAIRAAFKAVMSGKQVAILVPTTILTEQHFTTISKRLASYPIAVEMLSRFRTASEQTQIIQLLKEGEIDIIIGTHRLLSDDISYKNLGLLIIDEEHRFGVKHKEKIKQIRKNLDCLSMTATPIPRTLHMSLAKIRDMSIINTPPRERIPVETYVMEFDQDILRMGIENELARKGQVFFLYNRIKTINEMKHFIESTVPDARIVVAHGQMDADVLEDILHDFINYKYDIMLTTTIIESGIDIPRVNTIFIDRADRFGLAQLYQLRGRVGRSHLKAYAYLFYDNDKAITEDAMKKLRVISEYTDLGSGFKVAMKDMEIRGAGNMLGPEQHGDILAVGFSMYCKLLTDAVRELKKVSENPEIFDDLVDDADEIYLDIRYNGFIPDSYISDPREKIAIYKKITGVTSIEDMNYVRSLLTDRYGTIPPDVEHLLYIGQIRILCRSKGISDIIEKDLSIELKLSNPDKINIINLMSLVAGSRGNIYLNGTKSSSIFLKLDPYDDLSIQDKGKLIGDILQKL